MSTDNTTKIKKHAKISGDARKKLGAEVAKEYNAGASIRQIADKTGRGFATVRNLLNEAPDVELRPRGGGDARAWIATQNGRVRRVRERQRDDSDRLKLGDPAVRKEFSRALGNELRAIRLGTGMSATDFTHCLDAYFGAGTLYAYEKGDKEVKVLALLDICSVAGAQPWEVVRDAVRRASLARKGLGLRVDLRAVMQGRKAAFAWTRRWAANRLRKNPGEHIVDLRPDAITELAYFVGANPDEVMVYLAQFAPRNIIPMA